MPAVMAEKISKIFGQGDGQVVALKDAYVSVEAGEIVALMTANSGARAWGLSFRLTTLFRF
jgi:ABC-type lipoprotein export system ATPase subunit